MLLNTRYIHLIYLCVAGGAGCKQQQAALAGAPGRARTVHPWHQDPQPRQQQGRWQLWVISGSYALFLNVTNCTLNNTQSCNTPLHFILLTFKWNRVWPQEIVKYIFVSIKSLYPTTSCIEIVGTFSLNTAFCNVITIKEIYKDFEWYWTIKLPLGFSSICWRSWGSCATGSSSGLHWRGTHCVISSRIRPPMSGKPGTTRASPCPCGSPPPIPVDSMWGSRLCQGARLDTLQSGGSTVVLNYINLIAYVILREVIYVSRLWIKHTWHAFVERFIDLLIWWGLRNFV